MKKIIMAVMAFMASTLMYGQGNCFNRIKDGAVSVHQAKLYVFPKEYFLGKEGGPLDSVYGGLLDTITVRTSIIFDPSGTSWQAGLPSGIVFKQDPSYHQVWRLVEGESSRKALFYVSKSGLVIAAE